MLDFIVNWSESGQRKGETPSAFVTGKFESLLVENQVSSFLAFLLLLFQTPIVTDWSFC